MKQFTIWENPTDKPANWSSFHNADLPKLYETEFQGSPSLEATSNSAAQTETTAIDFKGCWYPSAVDSTHIRLTAGSFTCGSIFTPSVSSISVSSTLLNYIYLRATLSATTTDGYVSGGSATAVDILSGTSIPVSDNTYGYILLCSWQAGALVDRYEYFSLKARLNNKNVGDVYFEHGMA